MVDAIVSQVVQRLGDFLVAEVGFLRGVKNEVQWLKDELGWMQRFLEDAEDKQYGQTMIRKWVADMRELAYDIEDAFDIYNLKVQRRSGGILSICHYTFDKCKETSILHEVGKEIEEFKNKINDLSRRRQLYGLQDSGKSVPGRINTFDKLRDLRRSTSFSVEENVVGFEDDVRELLAKLLSDDPRRSVISIYGMGGLGKTTIAGKLYRNDNVRERFDYCAWVSVSQKYSTGDLLLRIIKSFAFATIKIENLEKMNEEDLERYLRKSLQRHSYLVVIDDAWDKEAWKCLKRAFPDNNNGSRVIITTRDKKVAESSDETTYAHELRYLRPDESWQLFCEKLAFQKFKADEGLEKLGKEMVQKCGGLPLAIIVLAGLLPRKMPQEWHVVRDRLWQHLRVDSIQISFVLALSFDSLPYQLKPCFLYLSLFPEDFEINIEKLIQLWMAEGFIPQFEDRIMEEMAKDFLDELINRSLVQVGRKKWGRISTCRVHDLLHDLALEKAKEFNFLCIYDEVNHLNMSSIISSCPRQIIYSVTERSSWVQNSNSHLRSLFLFDKRGEEFATRSGQLVAMSRKFSSLRVFNIEYYIYGERRMIAKEIGKLIHLKYLKLKVPHIDLSLIFKLRRLQTLDVCDCGYIKPHAKISKLQDLRHLIAYFEYGLTAAGMATLTKLQTLKYLKNQIWAEIKTENLANLRELELYGMLKETVEEFTFDSMANLKSLAILSIEIPYENSFSSLQPLSRCRNLTDLRLRGKILEKLPEDIHQVLPNLECLSLRSSQLKDDPMPLLEKLPNLMILFLGRGFYSGKKMMCSSEGFLSLEILLFERYVDEEIEQELLAEERAFPRLRSLSIEPKNTKLAIPDRLRSVPPPPDIRQYTPDFSEPAF